MLHRFNAKDFAENYIRVCDFRIKFWLALASYCMACVIQGAYAADLQYVYDASGRIIKVIAADGSSNEYIYDAVGNITALKKTQASAVWLAGFEPSTGLPGSVVNVQGGGFAPIISDNTIKFNGQSAVVSSVSANLLTVTVPVGATTGNITVSNSNGSASSPVEFVVQTLAPAENPIPLSINPNQTIQIGFSGTEGNGMILSFSNLATQPKGSAINVNVVDPRATLLKTCTLSAKTSSCQLPYLPVTGRYQIRLSSASSARFNLGLVLDAGAALATTPVPVTPVIPGQAISWYFSGQQGQQGVKIAVTQNSFPDSSKFSLVGVDGLELAVKEMDAKGGVLEAPTLPASGIYKVRAVPGSVAIGGAAARLVYPVTGSLSVDGSTGFIYLGDRFQTGYYSFNGVAGQNLRLLVTDLNNSATNGQLSLKVNKPDGNLLGQCALSEINDVCTLPSLPVAGSYQAVVGTTSDTMGAHLQLLSDLNFVATENAGATKMLFNQMGRAATLRFEGKAKQNLKLIFSDVNLSGSTQITVYQPDGKQIASALVDYRSGALERKTIFLNNLSLNGVYTVRVVPKNLVTGSMNAMLVGDPDANLLTGGSALSLDAGRRIHSYSFTGSKNQRLGLAITGLRTLPATLTILKSDGAMLQNCVVWVANGGCILPPLPNNDTYTAIVDSGVAELRLNSDLTSSILANGVLGTVSMNQVGQAATLTIDGTGGQEWNLIVSGTTLPGNPRLEVIRPDGGILINRRLTAKHAIGLRIPFPELPMSGTFSIRVVPDYGTGNIVLGVTQNISGTLTANASAVTVSLNNQNATLNFAGGLNRIFSIRYSDLKTTPEGGTVMIKVYTSNGTLFHACSVTQASGTCALPPLTSNGTHSVVISSGRPIAAKIQLTSP